MKLLLLIHFIGLNLLAAQPIPRTELMALLDLRGSLGITAKDWRWRVHPCSNWTGITCTNGSVTEIRLSGLRRTRRGKKNPQFAVDSLSKFPKLTTFSSSGFLLKGAMPEQFGQRLTNLEVLDLSSSSITGSITLAFDSLSRLKILNLSNNSLSAAIPAQIGKLSQLIELDLGFNSFFGALPEELGRLTLLRKMVVTNNLLHGPLLDDLFQKLTHLKYLDVSGNRLTGLFPNLSSFNATGGTFNLSSNQFYGKFSYWIGNFSTIDLSNNYLNGSVPNLTAGALNFSRNCFDGPGQRSREDCMRFYSDRGLLFGNGEGGREIQPLHRHSSRKRLVYIMIGVFGGLGVIVVLISGAMLLLRVCKSGNTDNQGENRNVRSVPGGTEQPTKVIFDVSRIGEVFTYEQMLLATGNFGDESLIKHGHSGDVFRGILEHQVVVKRVDLHSMKKESFLSELEFFGKVSHPRLVPLVGHCLEDEHVKFLVYKNMPNGDLSNALYRLTNPEEDLQSLDWITRLKIATGAAEALSYLHHECIPPIIHRDVQASSILLDDKYEVRLGSFSEVCSPEGNNHQKMITRLLHPPGASGERPSGSSPPVTCAYDVYCFGKVLLELVTGRFGISSLDNDETKQWLDSNLHYINMHEKELVMKIVDQSLIIDEDLLEEVWAIAIVAKSCLNPKPSRRPSMRQVLKALENPFKVVREEAFSSGMSRTASSRQAWTAAFLGSWHRSSSDSSNRSGPANRTGSRGSGANDHTSSHKRSSSDVFPEPDLERQDGTS